MPRRSGPSRLEVAVSEWVEAVFSTTGKPDISKKPIIHPSPSAPGLPDVGVLQPEGTSHLLRSGKSYRTMDILLSAGVSTDVRLTLTYCFMCLEGVLLDPTEKEDTTSRLVEAVAAYCIGASAAERSKLRREVKDLYKIRSLSVHTGNVGSYAWHRPRERALDLVSRVLRREIEKEVL